VVVTQEGASADVALNRPQTKNALDGVTITLLADVLAALASDSAVRVVVLRGADDTFCSGDDLREAGTADRSAFLSQIEGLQEVTRRLRAMPQPVIASIAGHALGGGLELALACDLRIAAADAQLGCPEASWGLTITNGASRLLAEAVGETRARELVLLGYRIDAVTAERYGLVSKVVPAETLRAATQQWADRLLQASPMALCLNKRLLAGAEERLERALRNEVDSVMCAYDSVDGQEGLRAFRERREPTFARDPRGL